MDETSRRPDDQKPHPSPRTVGLRRSADEPTNEGGHRLVLMA